MEENKYKYEGNLNDVEEVKKVEETEAKVDEKKKEEEDEVVEFYVEPIDFEGDCLSTFTTVNTLKMKIDELFRSIFVDFDECDVVQKIGDNYLDIINKTIQPNGWFVNLKFRELADPKAPGFRMLERRASHIGTDLLSRMNNVTGNYGTGGYVMRKTAAAVLAKFIPQPAGMFQNVSKKPENIWAARTFESYNTMPGGMVGMNAGSNIIFNVVGLPLESVLKTLYGAGKPRLDADGNIVKNKDGETVYDDMYDYGCWIVKLLYNNDPLLRIDRLNSSTVSKLYRMMSIDSRYAGVSYYGNPFVYMNMQQNGNFR